MAFRKKVRIYFDQGDPAQIAFHGQHSIVVQRVMEEYLTTVLGIPWKEYFGSDELVMPVVQINNTYTKPVYPGKEYWVQLRITRLGQKSIKCHYQILTLEKEEICCTVEAVYVCVDRKNFKSRDLPAHWRKILLEVAETS